MIRPLLVGVLFLAATAAEEPDLGDPADLETVAEIRERHAEVAVLGAHHPDDGFGVALGTDNDALVFEQGETIAFTVEVDRACHLHVFYADPEGESAMLFPNHWQRDAEVEAGTIAIPGDAAGFRFPVNPPYGPMYLKAIATAEPLELDGVDPDRLETKPFIAFGNLRTGMRNDGNDATAIHGTPLAEVLEDGTWATAELVIRSTPPAHYDHSAGDQILATWVEITTEGHKSIGGPAVRPPRRLEMELGEAVGVIVYPDEEPGEHKALAVGTAAGGTGPLAGARLVDGGRGAAKAIGDADWEREAGRLGAKPGVTAAIPNYRRRIYGDPQGRFLPVQWALEHRFKPAYDIGWSEAEERIAGIEPVLVGVVDQGLKLGDERLDAFAHRIPGEVPGNGEDDDRNGFVDDVHGYNLVDDTARPWHEDTDYCHGSFVASIIAGRRTGRDDDVIGIAPGAEILTAATMDEFGMGDDMTILKGIVYCAMNGAKVINLSLGGACTPEMLARYERAHRRVFDFLERKGVILVCAAGNENRDNDRTPSVPASLDRPNIVSVMAIDADGAPARYRDPESGEWLRFTNWGAESVDLAAPGSLILGIHDEDAQELGDGTSFAAPIVSATLALVWGQHPDWEYDRVIRAVVETARPVESLDGRCRTAGVIDVAAALEWDGEDAEGTEGAEK